MATLVLEGNKHITELTHSTTTSSMMKCRLCEERMPKNGKYVFLRGPQGSVTRICEECVKELIPSLEVLQSVWYTAHEQARNLKKQDEQRERLRSAQK